MAGYDLLASESTVQVLSPTLTRDIVYCTIRTIPSGVIASMPVDAVQFFQETVSTHLFSFAESIEEIMADSRVIAGAGSQILDANGLLEDIVVFTVQYIPPGTTDTQVTADAEVPVSNLFDPRMTSGGGGIEAARAIIDATYAALQSAAGG